MAGIRVRNIPKNTDERLLKIHFSKPKHGGGKIKEIYYPLNSNDAVVIFEDRTVVDDVIKNKHEISNKPVEVQPLPEHQVYSTIDATLDAEASVIVQMKDVNDEMRYGMEINITQEQDQTYHLHGNWFHLEWAWNFIDSYRKRQKVIQHKISQQPQQYAEQPMEVDESEDGSRDSRSEDRTLKKPWDQAQGDTKHHHPGNSPLYDDNEMLSQSYREDGKTASGDASRNRAGEPADKRSGEMSGTFVNKQGLRDNIVETERQLPDNVPDQPSIGHMFKPKCMDGTSKLAHENRRSRDENATFKDFCGQTSITTDPHQSLNKSLKNDSSRQASAQDENNSLLQSQSPVSSPSKSSYDSPRSYTEGSGRSTKPSVVVDQSVGLEKSKFGPRLKDIPRPYSEDQLLRTFDICGLKVTVYYGSLLEEDTEAIVNAANEQLSHYGGIAYAIRKARGREMDDECLKYITRNGNLKKTQVIHTSGGCGIKAQYIMHTVGPMWISDYWREDFICELTQTFVNCLEYAEDKLCIKTLAFPAISTGVHGAPFDLCVGCFLDAILIFTQQHGSSRRLADVRLVNNDAEKTNTSIVLMQTLIDSGIESLTEKAVKLLKTFTSKDQEMNLLTRHTGHASFSKTFTAKASASFGTTNYALSDFTSSHRRRSGSLSRDAEKRSSTEDKRKDETAVHKSHFDRDNFTTGTNRASWRPSESENSRHRERSGSFDRQSKNNPPYDFSKTVSGSLSYRNEGSSDRSSPKRPSTAEAKSSTVMPKMKQSLQTDVNEKVKSRRTSTKERLGVLSSAEYGAFTYKDQNHTANSRTFSDTTEDEEHDYGTQSLPAYFNDGSQKGAPSSREKIPSAPSGKQEFCAICLDEVKDPKQLPQCKHIFCGPCIQRHFASSKPSCPTCGALYGRVVGDQPEEGKMSYTTDRSNCLPGYETEDGMIIIKYTFPDGVQKYNHPHPGKRYTGLERKAYLPNSVEGREVLRLLKKAFDARLVFTIGDSKTSGRQDVLTWNDIHHKTNIAGGSTKFGYPDPGYLSRVKDELAAKGIVSDK